MKKLLFCLLILSAFISKAQVYNNEWIDHSKTYYKFKVGKTGLHRLPQSVIAAAGLGSTPAEYFQLWRNGAQIPIYTTVASGPLSASDYIEFWGEMNDGKPDKELYRKPEYQLNDKYSLQTDTATYFLTVDLVVSNNLRLRETTNNLAGNTLPVEPYFMYTIGNYFNKARLNNGYAVNVGETLYSSSYDKGEGYTSTEIGGTPHSFTFTDLNVYAAGPEAKFKIALSGNRVNSRRYRVKINSDSLLGKQMDYYNDSKDSGTFAANKLATTNRAIVEVARISSVGSDVLVIHQYELTYPRQFNFSAQQNFEFSLPANASGNYLEIKNFNFGSVAPVLYDLTNGKRYVGNISTPSIVKVALEPSLTDRRLVLVSQVATNSTSITASLEMRKFVDYSQAGNQGNYIIITNSLLIPSSGPNSIEDYKQYRSSVEGGGHNVLVALIDELVDQFAFGIKKHPMSIRNFLLYARDQFSTKPKNVLLIGKGVNYVHQRGYENYTDLNKLNLVPTFGWPASDMLLAANKGDSYPQIPIGRLSVVNSQEVTDYLKKIKEYEALQRFSSPLIKDMAWTKNVVHTVGASEESLQRILDYYMDGFEKIISDSLFGAKVNKFSKTSAETVEQIKNGGLDRLFEEGISLITYFGHSSNSALSYNLNSPENYKNKDGKYPVFFALGCMAGDFYNFNTIRFQKKETISESFVLAPGKGSIVFIASSHFGIPHYLDIQTTRNYKAISNKRYGRTIGEIMQYGISETFTYTTQEDFYARSQVEELSLHGDPAVTINSHKLPDYAIEDDMVRVNPSTISVADGEFTLNVKVMNIGRAVNRDIIIQVKQDFPNQSSAIVFQKKITGIRFQDDLVIKIPIDPVKDKGTNKLTVIVDALNEVEEAYETNNAISKEVFIYDDEVRPVYPYNFSIVNKQDIKFFGSTANPMAISKTYQMEIDTTALFNSPLRRSFTETTKGGVVEFKPNAIFLNNTVYFWRTGSTQVNGDIKWNTASFTYIADGSEGFKQSHRYQHLSSSLNGIKLDSLSGVWSFDSTFNNIFARNAIYPTSGTALGDFELSINNEKSYINGGCNYNAIVFNVFDPATLKPWKNTYSASGGLYGSLSAGCGAYREYGFEFSLSTSTSRKKAMDFLDFIPNGYVVIARGNVDPNVNGNTYVAKWKEDETLFGSGNSLYHKLIAQGVPDLDSFYKPRTYTLGFKKNGQVDLQSKSVFSVGIYDVILFSLDVKVPHLVGTITSPQLGPAKEWKNLNWDGASLDAGAGDVAFVNVIGVSVTGEVDTLYHSLDIAQKTLDISSIDAMKYPYLKLSMVNKDPVYLTPYRLDKWQVTYVPVPEGAVAPNLYMQIRDTVEVGEPIDFKIAFKNISSYNFSDSLKVKMIITDRNNVARPIEVQKHKRVNAFDTLNIHHSIDTKKLVGRNTLYVEVNPDNDQLEQTHFNNFIYKDFYVKGDSLNPVMDVTFDNSHILSGDIVAAKPKIQIKLSDEAKWMKLDDPSLVKVQVKFPNQQVREYQYNSDTLRFTGAQNDLGSSNIATIDFAPYFDQDGDYELIISGEDKSYNKAGELDHRINFKVFNKPMISNMLNYPNPFTTSTAFVFTITGSELPQNLRIQILTLTGKVVKEITKQELGPLRVGRNITEYKWDGTDQFGQKLGNGVYLYRVITNLNGKALDKFKSEDDNTDKYFNNGYGKMYLMR
jgi:hypothetical protein